MPVHVRRLAGPIGESALKKRVAYGKRRFWSERPRREGEKWLPGHRGTRMRSFEHDDAQLQYTLDNPVRHGLVHDRVDWPYRGEVTPLGW